MKTYQLNTRVNEEAYKALTKMAEKLHTTKGYLTEKAIYLLQDHFEKVEKSTPDSSTANDLFLSLLGQSIDRYHSAYDQLSK